MDLQEVRDLLRQLGWELMGTAIDYDSEPLYTMSSSHPVGHVNGPIRATFYCTYTGNYDPVISPDAIEKAKKETLEWIKKSSTS